MNNIKEKIHFQKISDNLVAIHPHPKGIVQFIGGAFFGSYPTIFYSHFLEQLFFAGYTIIIFPFRFSFDHWSITLNLWKSSYGIRRDLIKEVIDLNTDILNIYLNDKNYFWIGHSLGCKYILLLEILSAYEDEDLTSCDWEKVWEIIKPNIPESIAQEYIEEMNAIIQKIESIKDNVKLIYSEWLNIRNEIIDSIGAYFPIKNRLNF